MAENIFCRRRLHLCYVWKRAADSEKDHSKWNLPCVIGNFESNTTRIMKYKGMKYKGQYSKMENHYGS